MEEDCLLWHSWALILLSLYPSSLLIFSGYFVISVTSQMQGQNLWMLAVTFDTLKLILCLVSMECFTIADHLFSCFVMMPQGEIYLQCN
jgi:hypothetical protein